MTIDPDDPDYYEILGVREDASLAVIDGAYKGLAKEVHPDGTKPDEVRFKQIERAHAILSDDTERRRYDATRRRLDAERRVGPVRELTEGESESHGHPSGARLATSERKLTVLRRWTIAYSIAGPVLLGGALWWCAFIPLAFVTQIFAGYGPSRGHGGGFAELMVWVHLYGLLAIGILVATAWRALDADGRTRLVLDDWHAVMAAGGFGAAAAIAIIWFLFTGGPDRGNWFIGPLGAVIGLAVACREHWAAPWGRPRTEGDRIALARTEATRRAEAKACACSRIRARARIDELEEEAKELLPRALDARNLRDFDDIRLVTVSRPPIGLGRRRVGAYQLDVDADLLLLTDHRLMLNGSCMTLQELAREVRRNEGVGWGWTRSPHTSFYLPVKLTDLEELAACLRRCIGD